MSAYLNCQCRMPTGIWRVAQGRIGISGPSGKPDVPSITAPGLWSRLRNAFSVAEAADPGRRDVK